MHSVCQVPLKLDELICLLHCRLCDDAQTIYCAALPCTQVNVQRTDIEMLTSYNYLRVHLNNKLIWTDHTAATYKKGQSGLHLLRKLRSFGVKGALLTIICDSVVASAFFME